MKKYYAKLFGGKGQEGDVYWNEAGVIPLLPCRIRRLAAYKAILIYLNYRIKKQKLKILLHEAINKL